MTSTYVEFTKYDLATGAILGRGVCAPEILNSQARTGEGVLEGTAFSATHKVVNGAIVAKTTNEMLPSLDTLKGALLATVLAEFEAKVAAGYTYNAVLYQITDYSRSNMTGGAVLASLALAGAVTWPSGGYPWIATDNSIHLFTAAEFVAFGQAVATYYSALVFNSRALKNAIDALADAAACASFDATQGWP